MLGVLLSLALASSAPATPPDGSYTYQTSAQGSTGSSALVLTHAASGLQVVETASGSIAGVSATASATMMLNADLSPASYVGSYSGAGTNVQTTVTFGANGATETMTGLGTAAPQTYALGGAGHFAIVDGALVSGFAILPAQFAAWGNGSIQVVIPIYGRAEPIAVALATLPRPSAVPKNDVALTVSGSIPFTEWYDPKTLVMDEVEVPSQSVTITRIH
ncbi:MAG TPA: hypothetical protein VIJ12_06535 [Candidatus Baltobacteraceae bacterium]